MHSYPDHDEGMTTASMALSGGLTPSIKLEASFPDLAGETSSYSNDISLPVTLGINWRCLSFAEQRGSVVVLCQLGHLLTDPDMANIKANNQIHGLLLGEYVFPKNGSISASGRFVWEGSNRISKVGYYIGGVGFSYWIMHRFLGLMESQVEIPYDNTNFTKGLISTGARVYVIPNLSVVVLGKAGLGDDRGLVGVSVGVCFSSQQSLMGPQRAKQILWPPPLEEIERSMEEE
jgi:hypothetical protein